MRAILTLLLVAVAASVALAAPTVLQHGVVVSGSVSVVGGPIVENGETNATRPWVAGQIQGATGLVEQAFASRFVRSTTPYVWQTLNPTGAWYSIGGGRWTNNDGWTLTGTPWTNGIRLASNNDSLAPPVPTNGIARVQLQIGTSSLAVAWSSTDHVAQYDGAPVVSSDHMLPAASADDYLVAFDFIPAPDIDAFIVITGATIWAWSVDEYVGTTNELQGTILRVRDAMSETEPAAWGQVTERVHSAVSAISAADWATHPASADIAVNERRIRLDSQYSMIATDGVAEVQWQRQPVLRISGGSIASTGAASIVSLSATETTVTLVVASTAGWQPFPEWSTNAETWARLATNEFSSSWPTLSNGVYTLRVAPPATDAWYRVYSTNVSGNTIGGTVEVYSAVMLLRGHQVATLADVSNAVALVNAAGWSAHVATQTVVLAAGARGTGVVVSADTRGGTNSASSQRLMFERTDSSGVVSRAGLVFGAGATGVQLVRPDGQVSTPWDSLSLTPSLYQSVSAAQADRTNFWRLAASLPASNTAPGSVGQWWPHTTGGVTYILECVRPNVWARRTAETNWSWP